MNKILNWTFGSLFRTIGRLLGFLIVCILLLIIGSKLGLKIPDFLMPMKISAAVQNSDWLDSNNINMVSWGGIMDCTSASNCSSIGTNTQITSTQNKNFMYISATERVSSTTSGGGYGFYYNTNYLMKSGYLYNITTYVCSTKSFASLDFRVGTGTSSSDILTNATTPKFQDTIRTGLSAEVGGYCYAYQSLVVPGVDSHWFRTRLFGSATSDVSLSLIGYSIEGLGIYTNSIQDIITNSNLATNEDLTNVTNEIKEEQQNTTNAVEDMNNTINDPTSPDVEGMTDLAGYLPPGPLDSVLNLPLSILNSINSKLTSSCTPLSLTLPFVNLPLTIPCLSTIFNQINGLNTLFEFIGVICGALIMYSYLTYLYNWVDDVTSLKHNKARLFGAKSDADNWGGVE